MFSVSNVNHFKVKDDWKVSHLKPDMQQDAYLVKNSNPFNNAV